MNFEKHHTVRHRPSRDRSRAHKAWEVWSRGEDGDRPHFVEAYADKGEAQRKVSRLRASHPYAHYMLKHRRVASARTFGTRGHRRSRRDCVGVHTHDSAIGARRSSRDRLTTAKRRALRSTQFALPRRRALPIENASHVRNAAARLEQMRKRRTVTPAEYRAARARIVRAERRLGIHSRLGIGTSRRRSGRARRDPSGHRVYSYDSSSRLQGSASAELVRESEAEAPTGAVPAYRDERGVWQYVAPSQVDHYRRNLQQDVRTVYVE